MSDLYLWRNAMSDEWVRDYDAYNARQEEKNAGATWEVVRNTRVEGGPEVGWEIIDSETLDKEYGMPWEHTDDQVYDAFGIKKEEQEEYEFVDRGELIELFRTDNGEPAGWMTLNV